MLRDEKSND